MHHRMIFNIVSRTSLPQRRTPARTKTEAPPLIDIAHLHRAYWFFKHQ
jgi:hypothetical protein